MLLLEDLRIEEEKKRNDDDNEDDEENVDDEGNAQKPNQALSFNKQFAEYNAVEISETLFVNSEVFSN